MKVLLLAALVAVAAAADLYETKSVDADFIFRQKKVFSLLDHVTEIYQDAEYYKVGMEFDFEAHFDFYTNQKAVEEFLYFYRSGMLQKEYVFSVYYERMREEAIALYHLFLYAKDFDTFYKTAAWARVHFNQGLFSYAFTIAVLHRADTKGIVLPAPYEIYPFFFVNSEVINKMYRIQMQQGLIQPEFSDKYGIIQEGNTYTLYANYSGWWSYENEEQKLSYFTEDIDWNSYYYYFHINYPFWRSGDEYDNSKECRGEMFIFYYQRLLARYYMERLTNGLGEIPEFSWSEPLKTGYSPNLMYHTFYPFQRRNDFYKFQTPENQFDLQFVESYENMFLEFVQQGHVKTLKTEINLRNPNTLLGNNFVGNFWQSTYDMYETFQSKNYKNNYMVITHNLLGAGPEPYHPHKVLPVALEQYETALRDPAFYQLYKHIIYYFTKYAELLEPYTKKDLTFEGVKITDVTLDKLVTYFDFFDFDATNAVFFGKQENKSPYSFHVRQPRINQKPFDVKIEIESTVAMEAVVKFAFAPKYDSKGFPISLEDNWMNWFMLDWFTYNLTVGKNTIVRNSEDFSYFKNDTLPTYEILKYLESGKVPLDQSENYKLLPQRLMLPKGTSDGFPLQFFVMLFPAEFKGKSHNYWNDGTTYGYPFDRPLKAFNFDVPNIYFEDVSVFHEGENYAYFHNVPGYKVSHNEVPKH